MIAPNTTTAFTWSRRRRPYHDPACYWASRILEANRREGRQPEDCDNGDPRRPCRICKPAEQEEGNADAGCGSVRNCEHPVEKEG
jgi:hypothetical protein